jgi:hypothetical protein
MCRYLAKVLNKSLLDIKLHSYWESNKPGNSWVHLKPDCKARELSFGDIHNRELQIPSNGTVRPYRRALRFHAMVVNGKAHDQKFDRVSFKSFWTETDEEGNPLSYLGSVKVKVEEWLSRQPK